MGRFILIFFLFLLAMNGQGVFPDEAHGYPMMVRGGSGTVQFDFNNWTGETRIRFVFGQSRLPATQQQPDPGFCAWLDRPFRKFEPVCMDLTIPKGKVMVLIGLAKKVMGNRVRYDGEYGMAVEFMKGLLSEEPFYVYCKKDRNHFNVMKVGL